MTTPKKLGEILPQALANIYDRCNRYRWENELPLLYESSEMEGQPAETEFCVGKKVAPSQTTPAF